MKSDLLPTEISGDGETHTGLTPFSDIELLHKLLQDSIDVMQISDSPPTFSIKSSQNFLSEQPDNSSHNLPTNFIISLSYKPLNNTVLSLFSLLSRPKQNQSQEPRNSNDTAPLFQTFQSEFMLSRSATLVQSHTYFDLWTNFSDSNPLRYNLNLIVMNGQVGMCLDGDYHHPVETVQLWRNVKKTDSLELRFSPYLKSVLSLVKRHLHVNHLRLCNYPPHHIVF